MRIGIYGGSFNPPHIGHLNAAEQVYRLLRLDKMYIVPAGYPYFKDQSEIADKEDRYRMCKAFLSCDMKATISRLEIDRDGPSYMSDTIAALKERFKEYPNDEYFLLIGVHEFSKDLARWHNPEYLIDNVTFAVLSRGQSSEEADYLAGKNNLQRQFKKEVNSVLVMAEKVLVTESLFLNTGAELHSWDGISSTMIRRRIAAHQKFAHFVPESVAKYITNHELYGYKGDENGSGESEE